jgi:hypothetical protein
MLKKLHSGALVHGKLLSIFACIGTVNLAAANVNWRTRRMLRFPPFHNSGCHCRFVGGRYGFQKLKECEWSNCRKKIRPAFKAGLKQLNPVQS